MPIMPNIVPICGVRSTSRLPCFCLARITIAILAQSAYITRIRIVVCLVDYADTGSNPQDIVEIGSNPRGGRVGQAHSRILEIVTWLPEQLSGLTRPRVLASFSPT